MNDCTVKPLSECTADDVEATKHAFVYGRTRIWYHALTDEHEARWHWSSYAWWKAMWYPHRGPPSASYAWGVYAGSGSGCYTGPGDAELSHFVREFQVPDGAMKTKRGAP